MAELFEADTCLKILHRKIKFHIHAAIYTTQVFQVRIHIIEYFRPVFAPKANPRSRKGCDNQEKDAEANPRSRCTLLGKKYCLGRSRKTNVRTYMPIVCSSPPPMKCRNNSLFYIEKALLINSKIGEDGKL